MPTRLAAATRNAEADAAVDRLDAGAGPGTCKVYTGAQPASADDAATGTLLATFTLSDPAFGSAAAGVATANAIATVQAAASGTAGWFRAADSAGNTCWDGSATASGGGGNLQLDDVSPTAGQDISITSWTYTVPAS